MFISKTKALCNYFTKTELALWSVSVLAVAASFLIFDKGNPIKFAASLIGVTALILNAKGNPLGQFLMIVFSILYGIISYSFAYYGEMATYLGMSAPMALFALISWLKNPYNGNKAEVKINRIKAKDTVLMGVCAASVTLIFYFILKALNTSNLAFSTLSVTTSFAAVYLAFKRSPLHAAAYAANDAVLIILWVLASVSDISYLSVVICFAVFFVNDMYGFINWTRMRRRQEAGM